MRLYGGALALLFALPAHALCQVVTAVPVTIVPSVSVAPAGLAAAARVGPAAAPALTNLQLPLSAPASILPQVSINAAVRVLQPVAPLAAVSPLATQARSPLAAERLAAERVAPLAAAKVSVAAAATRGGADRSAEGSRHESSILFDGAQILKGVSEAPALPYWGGVAAKAEDGWTAGTFRTSDDATLHFKMRQGEPQGKAPTVFVGGLALAESYDSLFERQAKPESDQFFLWLRGHAPSEWKQSKTVFDQDARDLARMIVLAGERSGSSKIDLVLHSYSVLVFQKMVQLHDDAEVAKALALLKDARVILLMSTTHYGDSETAAGPQYAQMAKVIRSLIGWLDTMDSWADFMEASARLNPFIAPQVYTTLAMWKVQREAVLGLASKGAVDELAKHLSEPWDPAIDHIRQDLLKRVASNSAKSGWQEALLKRANDTSLLDFTKADVELIRLLGIHLDLVHAHDDQLVPWVSAKLLFDLLGVPAPNKVPRVGTVMQSPDGLFRVTIVKGDHYFPLKRPAEMEDQLDK